MAARLIDTLYTDAMLLADDARGYFEEEGREEREALPPMLRVAFSCESLKVTTRLMHVIAWLLNQRAVLAGELAADALGADERRLGAAADSDEALVAAMPGRARALIVATIDLHARAGRLDDVAARGAMLPSPARAMIERIERAF